MNKTHIVHLTSAHTRYDSRIFIKECKSLAASKYNVSLIVADGIEDEVKDSVKIINVSGKPKNRIIRSLISSYLVYRKAKNIKADIYHFHDPELLPYGLILSKFGNKVIYDIHEDLSQQILIKSWIPQVLRKPISVSFSLVEKLACKEFYSLVVPQDIMKIKFSKYNKNTETMYNFPNRQIKNIDYVNKNKFQVIYAGSISKERGIFNLLNLIMELCKTDSRYRLILAGPISPILLSELKNHKGWQYVNYKGVLNARELYKLYEKSSIGLILFNNVGQYHMSYALKLFEYMQNGLTIVMPNFGSWLDFNEEHRVGYCVNVEDSTSIAQVIHNLSDKEKKDFCIRNQNICTSNFTWESQTYKFNKIYNH